MKVAVGFSPRSDPPSIPSRVATLALEEIAREKEKLRWRDNRN